MYTTLLPDKSFDYYDEPRLHMEQMLASSITDLDIPMRIAIPLDLAGVRRIRDLVCLSREDLLMINRIGEKAVDEIDRILHRFDLSLEMKL